MRVFPILLLLITVGIMATIGYVAYRNTIGTPFPVQVTANAAPKPAAAPSQPEAPKRLLPDPIPVSRAQPIYPESAMAAGTEGFVELTFTVNSKGTVQDVKVLRSQPAKIFDDAAIAAVKKWVYTPAMLDGVSYDRPDMRVTIQFKLAK